MDSENAIHKGSDGCCQGNTLLTSRRIQGALTLVLILLAAFLFAVTIKALKEYNYIGSGVAETNIISVTGEGELFVVPDTAEFTFSISEEGDSVGGVQEVASLKANDVINALKEGGIEEKDIKTVAYELHPKYEWQPATCVRYPCDRKQVQTGFSLNQSVRVKVRDLDRAGSLLESVATAGVSSVSGLDFTLADEDAANEEVRKLAIDDAKAKANALAADLGVSLMRIVGFNESGSYPMPYMARTTAFGGAMDMAMEESVKVSVPAGENRMVSNVTITYEIR